MSGEVEYSLYIWEVFRGEAYEGGETLCRSRTLKTSAEFLIQEFQQPHYSRYDAEYLKAVEEIRKILKEMTKEPEGEVTHSWKFGCDYYTLQRVGVDD